MVVSDSAHPTYLKPCFVYSYVVQICVVAHKWVESARCHFRFTALLFAVYGPFTAYLYWSHFEWNFDVPKIWDHPRAGNLARNQNLTRKSLQNDEKIEKMRKSRKTGPNLMIHEIFDPENRFSLCWRSKSCESRPWEIVVTRRAY